MFASFKGSRSQKFPQDSCSRTLYRKIDMHFTSEAIAEVETKVWCCSFASIGVVVGLGTDCTRVFYHFNSGVIKLIPPWMK